MAPLLVLLFTLPTRINTDLFALLPSESTEPVGAAAEDTISEALARTVVVRLTSPSDAPAPTLAAVQREAAAALASSETLALAQAPGGLDEALLDDLVAHRFGLFYPSWLRYQSAIHAEEGISAPLPTWLAQEAVIGFDDFLGRPEAVAYEEHLAEDPLLLVPYALQRAAGANAATPSSNLEAPFPSERRLLLNIRGNPFDPEERPAIEQARLALESHLRAVFEGVQIETAGIYQIAAESEQRIKRDMFRMNAVSTLFVASVLFAFLRSMSRVLLLALPVLAGVIWGLLSTLLIFGRVHVMTLAMGSVIIGLAVDYGLHALGKRTLPGVASFPSVLAGLWRPLLIGWLSSSAGFLTLLFAPLGALREAGILIPVGLSFAIGTVWILYPRCEALGRGRAPMTMLTRPLPTLVTLKRGWMAILLVSLAAVAIFSTEFNDDIASFRVETQSEPRVRALMGGEERLQIYYATGATPAAVLRQTHLALRHGARNPLANLLIPPDDQPFPSGLSRDFALALQAELETAGFDSSAFADALQQLSDFPDHEPLAAFNRASAKLGTALTGPPALALFSVESGFAATVSLPQSTDPRKLRAAGFTVYSGSERYSDVLRHFREVLLSSLGSMLLVLGVAGLCVSPLWHSPIEAKAGLLQPLRNLAGWASLAYIPAMAVLAALVLWSLSGGTLSLLGLIGLLLAACIVLDYAALVHFGKRETSIYSVRLSAMTTLGVFAVLATSALPALGQIGALVSWATLTGWLLCETMPLEGGQGRPRSSDGNAA